MKMIETAPNWKEIINKNLEKYVEISSNSDVSEFINKCNKDYIYWDKFKYVCKLDSISPEIAWSFLRVSRNYRKRKIPLIDTKGNYFGYWLPDSFLKELHYLDQHASGEILVDHPDVPAREKERFLVSSVMEEAIASSQLEGAVTTRKVAKEMLRFGKKPENHAQQMCYNNYSTIRHIKDTIDKPLSIELLNSFQASMTKNTLDDPDTSGRFRTNKDDPIEVVSQEGETLHIPPPPDELQKRMEQLCKYANENDNDEFTHPVVKAIILHFWLAYVHPFVDGNGRTARALFYWYMLKNKYWLTEYLSISRIIKRAPSQYYKAFLYSEKDEQDITYFLSFHLRAIHLAIEELRKYLVRKTKEIKEATSSLIHYPGLNDRQSGLIYQSLRNLDVIYSIESHMNTCSITYETARKDLLLLEKKGLLDKFKKGKTFYYVPAKNLDKKLKLSN
mgnify:CR=1 FL=1